MLDCFVPNPSQPSVPMDLVSTATLPDWLGRQEPRTLAWVQANGFKAQAGRLLTIPGPGGERERIVFGLGDDTDPFLPGDLPGLLPEGLYHFDGGPEGRDPNLLVLAWALGAYRYKGFKSGGEDSQVRLALPRDVAPAEAAIIAEGVYLTRDLVNTPSNAMGPAELEKATRQLAERHGARVDTILGDDLLDANFPLIHAVGRASVREPRLIDLTWGEDRRDVTRITLVGKGVCFDSGGLSLKPAKAMELMKKDMGGAAHALGLAHMIMGLGLPVRLRVLIPAVENAVSGDAFRPGDVYTARNGVSVEIANTDAEGRLVLADAMAYGAEEEPDLVAVFATLTGAARVALGPEVVPFYTPDDELAAALAESAWAANDPVWRMPLYKPYEAMLHSDVADLNHVTKDGFAGSVTAALFLGRFVGKARTWVHFDVYAWNPQPKPGRPMGGEAQVVRGLFNVLQHRYASAYAAGGQGLEGNRAAGSAV